MSARTTSAPRARRIRTERRRALSGEAMGGVAGVVGLRYEMMGRVSLTTGASVRIDLTSATDA